MQRNVRVGIGLPRARQLLDVLFLELPCAAVGKRPDHPLLPQTVELGRADADLSGRFFDTEVLFRHAQQAPWSEREGGPTGRPARSSESMGPERLRQSRPAERIPHAANSQFFIL